MTPAEQGRQAALDGLPLSSCPYRTAQGSPDRPAAFAWRKGYREGEIEQGEADGDLFRSRLHGDADA